MKLALLIMVGALTLTACDTKDGAKKSQSIALHVCPSGGGEILLSGDSPEAVAVHHNNAGCVLDYLATFKADPLNGKKPTSEQAALCSSVARVALVAKSDLEAGKPLQEGLTIVAENANPMVARSMAKIISHVYNNPQQSGEDARALLELQCKENPRAFYIITGEEVGRYRVLNGPPSPAELATAEVQRVLERAPSKNPSDSIYEHVRDCVNEATRDKSLLSGVTNDEIEAACRSGLSR